VTTAHLRPRAEDDLVEKTLHYRRSGGEALGERFFNAALAAVRFVERNPGTGSPLEGTVCDIPGLRSWPVKGFPMRWYYFFDAEHLDMVRLLANAQDLEAALAGGEI
jgi:toxin ParE1/3/4